jgi:hypothetical protein
MHGRFVLRARRTEHRPPSRPARKEEATGVVCLQWRISGLADEDGPRRRAPWQVERGSNAVQKRANEANPPHRAEARGRRSRPFDARTTRGKARERSQFWAGLLGARIGRTGPGGREKVRERSQSAPGIGRVTRGGGSEGETRDRTQSRPSTNRCNIRHHLSLRRPQADRSTVPGAIEPNRVGRRFGGIAAISPGGSPRPSRAIKPNFRRGPPGPRGGRGGSNAAQSKPIFRWNFPAPGTGEEGRTPRERTQILLGLNRHLRAAAETRGEGPCVGVCLRNVGRTGFESTACDRIDPPPRRTVGPRTALSPPAERVRPFGGGGGGG